MPVLFLVFMVLMPAATGGFAYTYGLSTGWAIFIGLGIGFLAAAALLLPRRLRSALGLGIARNMELLTKLFLIVVSVAVAHRAIQMVVAGTAISPTRILPLLIAVVALYIFYLLVARLHLLDKVASVPECLTSLLSGPPLVFTLAMAVIISSCVLVVMHYFQLSDPSVSIVTVKFLERGIIPPLTVVLFFWGLLMLVNKAWTLWLENRQRHLREDDFRSILLQTYHQAVVDDDEKQLASYIDMLWKKSAEFYVIPRYINWAIPILGFIGTVLGISLAADGIQRIINSSQGMGQLSTELGAAITPLGIAFDTTLIALSLSVVLVLLQTALQRWEDGILIDYENRIRNGRVPGA